MGRKFQKKKKVEQLEIVPLDENPALPPQRPSDEAIPRKVSIDKEFLLRFSLTFHSTGKMDKQTTRSGVRSTWY